MKKSDQSTNGVLARLTSKFLSKKNDLLRNHLFERWS